LLPIAALALGLMLGGSFTQNYQRGCILAEGALELITLFNLVSRTTPTGGQKLNYLTHIFKIFGGE
jgi:hypothetical protein